MPPPDNESRPVALVTGGATRIGAGIVRCLHTAGYNISLHYNHSQKRAFALALELNTDRKDSVHTIQADLQEDEQIGKLSEQALSYWGKIDVLINNASIFYPTPAYQATREHWEELMKVNAQAPFFLVQKLANSLRKQNGSVVNITDIHAESGLKDYSIYSMTKAALVNMTRVMAKELAPHIRVNAIAPGAILWPESDTPPAADQQAIVNSIPLKKMGQVCDIANAVLFLTRHGTYITGQVIKVDGGRSLTT